MVLEAQWFWRHNGSGGTMVLEAQWFWMHNGSGGTMVLDAQWFKQTCIPMEHSIGKRCLTDTDLLEVAFLGARSMLVGSRGVRFAP